MYKSVFKRLIDLSVSLVLMLLLFPLYIFIAVLIKFDLGSPVMFKQERPGLHEKIFTMYKFRTMNNEYNSIGNELPDSERTSRLGSFLRSTSLDEIPGLLNVIQGDMSLVGPRPLLVKYLQFYSKEERKRHSVKPGLTGLAQIEGRNLLSWDERFKKDIEYVEKISFSMDAYILMKTVKKVIKKEGVLATDKGLVRDLDVERGLGYENIKNN